jgi:DNA replication and repair protein RecF
MTMVQIDKPYLNNLSIYKKVLKERNALLKNLKASSDMTFLKIINKRLENEADKIIEKREEFIKKLNKAFKSRFKSFNKNDDVELVYEPNVQAKTLESVLNGRIKADLLLETTSAGPHRDELLLVYNKQLAKEYASQGQIRLITLSLKLALLELYENKEEIVILLDDVLSELDEVTINELSKILKLKNQIIITGTNNKYKEMKVLNLDKKENQ